MRITMNSFIFLIIIIKFANITLAEVSSVNAAYPLLDRQLHEEVLDSKQCQQQLQYLWQNNTMLLAQFLDAGLRVPRGILKGNFRDFGLFEQCLGIHENFGNTYIDGKYCSIRVPVNQNVTPDGLKNIKWDFDPNLLQIDEMTRIKFNEQRRYLENIMAAAEDNLNNIDVYQESVENSEIFFTLALCIPKVCTTQDFLSESLLNLTGLGFQYQDYMCRLPDDRTWSAADNVATVIFCLIGLVILLSTSYDIHHIFIRKKDPKEANVLLTSFSAYKNCSQLLIIENNPKAIHCLDGIRALATFWVVIGHVFFNFNYLVANQFDALEWTQTYKALWIMTAPLSVDTFFLLSGLLLTYTTCRKLETRASLINLPFFFLFRLLRITPVLAVVVLFEASFLNRLGDGPFWAFVMKNVQGCREYWWSTLLHIHNYVSPNTCIPVSWYLAIDVNLHLISTILFCFLLGRGKKNTLAGVSAIFLLSLTVSTAYIFLSTSMRDNHFKEYYINIVTRSPPFFLGILYGYVMNLMRGKRLKMPLYLNVLTTISSLGLIALVLYLYFEYLERGSDNMNIMNVLDAFVRTLWCLALGWIIFVCSKGYGGPINWFLSLNIWKIPARISYSMYLMHMSIIIAVYGNVQQPLLFNVKIVMFHFMAFFAIAMVAAFLMTALIDAPFAILTKIVFDILMAKPSVKESNKITAEEEKNDIIGEAIKTTKTIAKSL